MEPTVSIAVVTNPQACSCTGQAARLVAAIVKNPA